MSDPKHAVGSCRRCKTPLAVPVTVSRVSLGRDRWGNERSARRYTFHYGGKRTQPYESPYAGIPCPCGHSVGVRVVEGRVSEGVPCDARCTGAKGHTCDCSCGGANHGAAYLIALGGQTT